MFNVWSDSSGKLCGKEHIEEPHMSLDLLP